MALDNEHQTENETATRPRRRRAASRPAGPPAHDDAADVLAQASPEAPEALAAPATPVHVEAEVNGEVLPDPAPVVRRRAPRKRAVAAQVPVAAPELADPAPELADPAPELAPAIAAPVRRRRTRKAVEPDLVAIDLTDLTAEPLAAEPLAAEPPAADPGPAAVVAPAAPLFAMPIFQAPEPVTAPRRRRAASRPAGPPAAPDEVLAAASDEEVGAEPITDPGLVAIVDLLVADLEDVDDVDDVAGVEELDDDDVNAPRRRRRRGGRGRRGRAREDVDAEADASQVPPGAVGTEEDATGDDEAEDDEESVEGPAGSRRRRRRRRRGAASPEGEAGSDDPPNTVVRVREARRAHSSHGAHGSDDVSSIRGSTRLEAKKQRRREGREAGRRRPIITEAEFLARRESVERVMVVRENEGRTQIGVLEDGVLVEHYVARRTQTSSVGNVYLGKVQNVLPSMEAAFVDIGKGRNAVLYAGEVNWDAAGMEGQPKRIEHALKSGESVLVQVTKDPIGHKGARLTSQVSLAGRYLVYVPDGSMTGISRKLPENERARLKTILRGVVPEQAGVIVRTAAEGASEEELRRDVARLQAQWEDISRKSGAVNSPALLYGEPDLAIRVVRDIFNEDFGTLVVSGEDTWDVLHAYIGHVAPDLVQRLRRWEGEDDVFAAHRIDEQLAKALDRKVWLPSGGSLVIDRTEAMTVVDVNTGKFTGSGGNLEETVTKNNIEAAEEIVRQLRLRDIGGIIVVDFIDMVLESNRELVLRRLLECLGRDRTKHQVAEVTSLGLVQMTRKRVGSGLLEVFSETCEHCEGRGIILHDEPVEKQQQPESSTAGHSGNGHSGTGHGGSGHSGNGHNGGGHNGARGRGRGRGDSQFDPASEASVG